MRAQSTYLRQLAAFSVAVALHAVGLAWWTVRTRPSRPVLPAPSLAWDDGFDGEPIELVNLIEEPPLPGTEPLVPLQAAADSVGFGDEHPLPRAEADLPGQQAAARGGGEGGETVWTGRDDGDDLREQMWNSPNRYQLARRATGRDRASPEALAREPERGFETQTERRPRRARAGQREQPADAATGTRAARSAPVAPVARGTAPSAEPAPQRVMGALEPGQRIALVHQGAEATDAPERSARLSDDVDSSAASNQTHPSAFDLTTPSAGELGDGESVAGPDPDRGLSSLGSSVRDGSAAMRADAMRGSVPASTRARRTTPYFRHMYERVDRLVTYPKELALGLDQGEVVVRFALLPDGSVRELVIEKSSGYAVLDSQVIHAIDAAGPYGPVPADIIGARDSILVRAPYAFRNPWIR